MSIVDEGAYWLGLAGQHSTGRGKRGAFSEKEGGHGYADASDVPCRNSLLRDGILRH